MTASDGAEVRSDAGSTSASRMPAKFGPQLDPFAGILLKLAWVSWIASLALPSFVVYSQVGSHYGLITLVTGVLFGWMVFGWAAYANIFFIYASARLISGRLSPSAILAMALLAITIVGFDGVVRDEGSGTVLPVVSWGWGAILWGTSLILLTLATLVQAGSVDRRPAIITLKALMSVIIGLGLLGLVQRSRSNLQEREMYFPFGIAFTTARLSKLPLVWPDFAVVPKDAVVVHEIDDSLLARSNQSPYLRLPLPTPTALRKYGGDWRVYDYGEKSELLVRTPSSGINYLLQAKQTEYGVSISIIDLQNNKKLYEQPLKESAVNTAVSIYQPEIRPWKNGEYGVSQAIERALGIESFKPQNPIVVLNEASSTSCGPIDISGGIKNSSVLDGREVIFKSKEFRTLTGFCTDHYIALVDIRQFEELGVVDSQVNSIQRWRATVRLHDRVSLAPVGVFYDGKPWDCNKGCVTVDRKNVNRVRITNTGIIVETSQGEIAAEKRLH